MPKLKLFAKLTLLVGILSTVIAIIASLAIGAVIFTLTEKQVRVQLVDESFQIIREYLEVVSGTVQLKNRPDDQTLVAALRNFNLSVYIFGLDGREIGSYGIYRNLGSAEKSIFLPPEIIARAGRSPAGIYQDISLPLLGSYDTFTVPLLNGDTAIGYLQIARQNNVLPLIKNAIVMAIIILVPLVWLAAIATGIWGTKIILDPLQRLVQYIAALDINHLPRQLLIPTRTDEEVKVIAEGFNSVLQRVNSVLTRQKQIAANISHEFKTPLARISSSLEVLAADLSGSAKKQVNRLNLEAINLGRQVDTLLDLALSESNRQPARVSFFLHQLVRELIAYVPPEINLIVKIPPSMKLSLPQGHLRIVLQNLISNAVRYNSSPGEILISAQHADNHWQITVENTTSPETKLRRDGHGLGLTIVKDICRQQNLRLAFVIINPHRISVTIASV